MNKKEKSSFRYINGHKGKLKVQYHGQLEPQPVYLELLCYGDVWRAGWYVDEERGNSTPMDVLHGLRLRFYVRSIPRKWYAKKLITDNSDLIKRIVLGHSLEWNGSNYIGVLSDDARAASEELEKALSWLDHDNCL